MKTCIRPTAILFAAAMLAASCLSTDDDTEITYYGDTAITSFSLGTLNREMHTTTSDGKSDSTYTGTLDASTYKFYIDQAAGLIYNADSLPVRTDASKTVCNIETKNGGLVVVQDINKDTLRYFSSSDSLDFTPLTPDTGRVFRVYSTDGLSFRKYNVKVNVHKEDPDSFRWNAIMQEAGNPFASAKGMRATEFNGKIYVFATDGTATTVYATPVEGGTSWQKVGAKDFGGQPLTLDGEAYANATVFENMIYTLSGGQVLVSPDGESWTSNTNLNAPAGKSTPVDYPVAIKKLLGATKHKIYAQAEDGSLLWSELHGVAWNKDDIAGGDPAMLPTGDISLAALPLGTDAESERVVLVGNPAIDAEQGDSVAVAWSKIEELEDDAQEHGWILVTEQNLHCLPAMAGMQTLNYGGALAAIGGSPLGASTATAFAAIYTSRDNGLTWHGDDKYVMPTGFDNAGSDVFAVAADGKKCLWIICGGTGKVWRGRLNSLGWADEQTSFTK